MMELEAAGVDGIAGLVRLAHLSTVDSEGHRQWETEQEARLAPWPVIKACADEALVANGLTGEDGAGNSLASR
jgi:hypothetical protein